jgi:uncharacterized protein (TIGR03086 family)
MELLEALSESFDHASKVVGGVQPDQLDTATPCTEWDVRALLGHTVGVVVNMGRGASGLEPVDPATFELAADPGAQFRTEADRTLAAWSARGTDGQVDVGAGPMPAEFALSINVVDTTTHSWDLARATGQDAEIPDDLAGTALAVVQGFMTDQLRAAVGFAAPVPLPAGASATDQLVAFLGRRP